MSLVLILSLAAASSTPQISEASRAYRDDLVARAKARDLHEERQWQLLLHYKGRLFGGKKSEADGLGFFADPDGKFDPEAELAATLEAFFEPTLDEFHPQCRFAARYKWLDSVLSFDRDLMPEASCAGLERYLQVMDPASATLIFASAYINAPPSMYGHTFLRIDRRTAPDVPLLSHILNYSANPYTSNPLFYTVLGITGGFEGHFEGMPYYVKIREYSDLESRDLWEYELDLSADQLDTMLRHTWELDHTHFNYYFFDENCSYHLLSLLEVADPSLRLTNQFPAWVIPTDTLQAVLQKEGLVRDRTYRPSHATKMRARADRLSSDELSAVKKLVEEEGEASFAVLDDRSPERQAVILESAHDIFKYKNGFGSPEDRASPEALQIARREKALLDHRSSLQLKTEATKVPPPRPPESGHGSARIGTSGGVTSNGDYAQEVEWRAAFHDFLDRQPGFVSNTQLEMLALALRVIPEQAGTSDVVVLERVDALNIMSVTPWTRFAKPLSWRVDVGYRRVDDIGPHTWNNTTFELRGGPGLALESHILKKEVFYLFTDLQFEAGPAFSARNSIRFSGDVAFGMGIDFTDWWRLSAEARVGYVPVGDPLDVLWQVKGGMNFALAKNWALRLEGGYFRRAEEAHAGLLFYY